MSQQQINPLKDWESEELSEAELDVLAGGRTNDVFDLGADIPSFTQEPVYIRQSDNIFTHDGQKGTTLGQLNPNVKPLNMTLAFP